MPEGVLSWAVSDRGPYIKLHSGRRFYLDDPQPEDLHVDDIAHHLAGINRYTGGSRYTVAQHCVVASRMARLFYPNEKMLPARMLIHDVDEFAYGDVNSPLKSLLPDYRHLEEKAQLAVEQYFDLTFIGDPLVGEVDVRMWLTERERLFDGRHGDITEDYNGPLEPFVIIDCRESQWGDGFEEWSAKDAEGQWLFEYRRLFPWHH